MTSIYSQTLRSRSLETQKSFTLALLRLMRKHPYDDISVKAIVGEAHRTRQTFYRHFTSKDEVLQRYIDALYDECYASIVARPGLSLKEALVQYFEFWYAYREPAQQITTKNPDWLLRENTFKYMHRFYPLICKYLKIDDDDTTDPFYFKEYLFGGLVQMELTWFKNGCDETPSHMANSLIQYWNA